MKLHLLPQPASVEIGVGYFRAARDAHIVLPATDDPPVADAALCLARALRRSTGRPWEVRRDHPGKNRASGSIVLAAAGNSESEDYRIRVRGDRLSVRGAGPRGLFYGIQTLLQLVGQFGARIPCCQIADHPAFPHRGYYLDISRGRVPTLHTLKRIADRLAFLKINQLQLYVEHVFAFSSDPSISRGCSPITAAEILALDAHCRRIHIELVPSLACFGHMGRILSLPPYRHLAEKEWPARNWNRSAWIQRLRGATIDPYQPEGRKLIARLLDDFLPLFSSGHFHMCGDETYDLGKGRNAARARQSGIAALYLRHLRFVRKEASKHGKELMFWGDVMLHHPESISDIPSSCTVLDWGYEPDTPFEKVRRFTRAGLAAYVCPSTRGYRNVFNEVEQARGNIAGYARAGLRCGASGVLTTDWGDMGHFNLPACSLHGMALGAAMAWNPESDETAGFDRAFSLQLFGDATGEAARLFRKAGTTGVGGWPLMLIDLDAAQVPTSRVRRARSARVDAANLRQCFSRLSAGAHITVDEISELSLACSALELNAAKILLEKERLAAGAGRRANSRAARRFAGRLRTFFEEYRRVWLRTCKPSGIKELERAFLRAARHIESCPDRTSTPLRREDLP